MPSFLTSAFQGGTTAPLELLIRLVLAMGLGAIVAWIYRHTRDLTDASPTFPATLVLLSVLIAMVTQVIGDNVARAFSLVGALSIVRFRTVVRDTQDTAFVIFAVVVGMAVGANHLWVAGLGLVVVGVAAALMRPKTAGATGGALPEDSFTLTLRIGIGVDLDQMLGGLLDTHLESRHLLSIRTARQGISIEVSYTVRLKATCSPDDLVKALNLIDGVQSVELTRDLLAPE
jgi:hypothetical protein